MTIIQHNDGGYLCGYTEILTGRTVYAGFIYAGDYKYLEKLIQLKVLGRAWQILRKRGFVKGRIK